LRDRSLGLLHTRAATDAGLAARQVPPQWRCCSTPEAATPARPPLSINRAVCACHRIRTLPLGLAPWTANGSAGAPASAPLPRGQDRDVVGDVGRIEVGRIHDRHQAAGGDPVDE
jgi:hypothetical protein